MQVGKKDGIKLKNGFPFFFLLCKNRRKKMSHLSVTLSYNRHSKIPLGFADGCCLVVVCIFGNNPCNDVNRGFCAFIDIVFITCSNLFLYVSIFFIGYCNRLILLMMLSRRYPRKNQIFHRTL